MLPQTLTLVAYGNPLIRSTWSSAPYNIFNALTKQGCTVSPVNSLTSNKPTKFLQLIRNQIAFQNSHFRRGPYGRAHAARLARIGIDEVGHRNIFHMSLNHLPLPEIRTSERHFLYLDFTYDLRINIGDGTRLSTFERTVEAMDRRAYAQIDHFFACSQYVKENLVSHYEIPAERITVIGSGLSTGFIRPAEHRKDYGNGEILFSSKIKGGWDYKGGALLLKAFKLAYAQNDRLRLTVVGQETYKKIVAGIPGVTAYGYIAWEELQELFDRASLYAMPALQEPWGVVYLEALACKMPILGLNRYAFPQISQNGKYGFISPDATPESVAETLLNAMSSPERLAIMGEAGQRYVLETYSWEKVALAIIDRVFG